MLVGPNEFTDFYKLLISNYTILSFTSWLYFFKLHLFVFEYVECMMCVCGWVGNHATEYVDVRGQLWGSQISPFTCPRD